MTKIKVNQLAADPAEIFISKTGLDSEFGEVLVVSTQTAICELRFVLNNSARKKLEAEIKKNWPKSKLVYSDIPQQLFNNWGKGKATSLEVKATPFQLSVWRALVHIPKGTTCAYGDIAKQIKRPKAVRAVGTAVAKNRIAWIIPCHRVIRNTGEIGQYYWGSDLKKKMLDTESND